MAEHELILHNQRGTRLRDLQPVSWSLVRRVNTIGKATIVMPHKAGLEYTDLKRDQIVTISRSLPGSQSYLEGETLWFLRGREWSDEALTLTLEDANTLLKRRIVAYYAKSAQAYKTGAAADLIRAIMRENFGSLAGSTRSLTAFMSIQADDGSGPTIEKGFAWRPVYSVIKEVAEAAEEAGTFCGFDVVCTPAPLITTGGMAFNLEFRVFRDQRGIDHRWPNGERPVLIGSAYGSLANPRVSEMWTDEESLVYAGGAGKEDQRLVVLSENQTLIDQSIFGLFEGWRDASRIDTTAGLQAEGQAQLAARAGRTTVTGDFRDTEHVRYGAEVRFGDFVTVTEAGVTTDARFNAVQLSVSRQGEDLKARLEGGY